MEDITSSEDDEDQKDCKTPKESNFGLGFELEK